MKRILVFLTALTLLHFSVLAQSTNEKTPQETARAFTRQGDFSNAILVLNAALQKDPQNLELSKDLAFNYYWNKDYTRGLVVAKPLADRPDADVQTFQIVALLYKGADDMKECDKLYRAGLKRFPRSGPLHSEYGEVLWSKNDFGCIKEWEKGIEDDPNYSANYYYASKYYYFANDRVWTLIYGEMFINLESYTRRTAEMKDILLETYKKMYAENDLKKTQDSKNTFIAAWANVTSPLSFAIKDGITAESLTVLRTKFIINWFNTYPNNYPFRLFEYQRQLLKEGMFDAYNQWIFGAAGNLPAFQTWTNVHGEEYKRFVNFQQGRVFKMPEGQYYQVAAK
jgi:tetratricopeptide (TPR) repeat protein